MATALTKPADPSDLILRVTDKEYSYEEVTITNETGDEITVPLGHPVTLAGVLVEDSAVASEDSTLKGLVTERLVIPDGESRKVAALVRGPAIIRTGGLPTADYTGGAYDMTKFKSEIAKLSPKIVIVSELASVSTQST